MFLAIEIIIGVVVLVVGKYFWERKKLSQFSKQFPGPEPTPFIGNMASLPSDPIDIFRVLNERHITYGKNVSSWGFGLDWRVFITNLNDLGTILGSNKLTKKGLNYRFIKPWLGDGLILSSGQKWFHRRRIITPTFHFNILQQFLEVFDQQVAVMVEKLKKHVNSDEFNIEPYVTLCALDIINETAMGVKINAQNDPHSKFVEAVHVANSIIYQKIFSFTARFPWLYALTPTARREQKALKVLHDFTDEIIRARKEELQNENSHEDVDDCGRKKRATFLEQLLKSSTIDGSPLTPEDIREEVDTFMFAGHDTTTNGIGFTLFHLSNNPDVQEKLYQEIVQIFGKDSTIPVTYNSINELKYLDMVIKESMRVTPPVPSLGRLLTEETVIGDVKVPANTTVQMSIYALHHDKDNFPDPDIFDPERFSPDNSLNRNPYSYIPFSAGPRNCIGQKFAMLEMKTLIMRILMAYKLLPGKGKRTVRLRADLVLRSADGWNIKIVPRKV